MNDIEKWNKLYYSGPSEAEVEWQFIATASEKTTDEGESEVPKSPGGSQSSEPKGLFPRTGEILSNGFVWIGLILVAIVYIHSSKKRRSKYR
nr:LPXTG cell wall anchor domain-containing protein [Enterococcus hulanensis]